MDNCVLRGQVFTDFQYNLPEHLAGFLGVQTETNSSSDAGRASHCFFCRLRQLHRDEVFLRIKIVFARLVNDANLAELGGSFVGYDLIELP
jgi:hypothetical protein